MSEDELLKANVKELEKKMLHIVPAIFQLERRLEVGKRDIQYADGKRTRDMKRLEDRIKQLEDQ